MANTTVATFLRQLAESQLLEPAQIDEVQRHPLAQGSDPVPLAKDLVQKGRLTAFQVKSVLQGRGKDLILGNYRLLDCIGTGGMGQVFRASHLTMDRVVALKIIRKEKLAQPMAVQRFYQEVRLAAQLAHPNIVQAFDAGQVGDTHFFAMEFVEGIDLARLVKESGPLPVADACEYIRQAASGLAHAHEKGLIHRDIKPANLLLSTSGSQTKRTGTIKILDMGLARLQATAEQPDKGLTRVGTVVGTPEYLAPEQAMNARTVDGRADLYSLGCTFYCLLTGRPPFRGENLTEFLIQHQTDAPPPVTSLRADVPPGIAAIVHKLLAKRPEGRYQTPTELADALAGVARVQAAIPAATVAPAAPLSFEMSPAAGAPVVGEYRRRRQSAQRRRMVIAASFGVLALGGLVLAFAIPSAEPKQTGAVARATQPLPGTPLPTLPVTRPQETRPTLPPPPTTPANERVSLTGVWRWTYSIGGGGGRERTGRFKLEGDKLTGVIFGRDNKEYPIEDVKFKDGDISFKAVHDRKDNGKYNAKYEGRFNGETIKGKIEADFPSGVRTFDWEARRIRD